MSVASTPKSGRYTDFRYFLRGRDAPAFRFELALLDIDTYLFIGLTEGYAFQNHTVYGLNAEQVVVFRVIKMFSFTWMFSSI